MLSNFQKDFWMLSRERKGYYALADRGCGDFFWKLQRRRRRGDMWDYFEPHQLVESLFEDGLGLHPLLDVAFEAFARAEARLGLRFIPQRSNEERLTGHLISELEAAVHLAADSFAHKSIERYGARQAIDFAYYDLSQGGPVEKETGGDFGLILSVDLPDRPRLVTYTAIQAKRLHGRASVDKRQYDTVSSNFNEAAAYLFYDCSADTLAPPMIMSASSLNGRRHEKPETASFTIDSSSVFSEAVPLSLWLVMQLASGKSGVSVRDFSTAFDVFRSRIWSQDVHEFSRLAMVSIGRPFEITRDIESGLQITL